MTKNDEILIIYTSWYTDFINEMTDAAMERLESEDCMIKSFKALKDLIIQSSDSNLSIAASVISLIKSVYQLV